jgi:hypothetical protein
MSEKERRFKHIPCAICTKDVKEFDKKLNRGILKDWDHYKLIKEMGYSNTFIGILYCIQNYRPTSDRKYELIAHIDHLFNELFIGRHNIKENLLAERDRELMKLTKDGKWGEINKLVEKYIKKMENL